MDSERLGHLIDRLAAALTLFARQWCDAPEDVVQEAFVKLASQSSSRQNPDSWLFRTVRNGAINAGIAGQRRRRHETAAAHGVEAWFEEESSARSGAMLDPESTQSALSALPGDQREVIVLKIWHHYTFDEIGRLLEISPNTAAGRYRYGIQKLRHCLRGNAYDEQWESVGDDLEVLDATSALPET